MEEIRKSYLQNFRNNETKINKESDFINENIINLDSNKKIICVKKFRINNKNNQKIFTKKYRELKKIDNNIKNNNNSYNKIIENDKDIKFNSHIRQRIIKKRKII